MVDSTVHPTNCRSPGEQKIIISESGYPVNTFVTYNITVMKARIISIILIAVLLVLALWFGTTRKSDPVTAPAGTEKRKSEKSSSTRNTNKNDNRGFSRKVSYLEYSVHAKCRMRCRRITQEEVRDIMQNGTINYAKSDLNDNPCPTYALEGITAKDKQHVRIVFAQCNTKTKVVTCIDLENDFACDCK